MLESLSIIHEDEVSSTSDLAAEAARSGAAEGVAYRGSVQTKGRGRHGREWVSGRGNLYISVILRPVRARAEWSVLSLVASLAVYDALSIFRNQERLGLKWPNDVLLDGRKCGGLLLEVVGDAVIVGCGVNCVEPGGDLGEEVGWLNQRDGDDIVSSDEVLRAFESSLVGCYNEWQESGFKEQRERWMGAAAHLGLRLEVSLGAGGVESGVFETLGENGALGLRGEDGELIMLESGEVTKARAI